MIVNKCEVCGYATEGFTHIVEASEVMGVIACDECFAEYCEGIANDDA